MADRRSKSSAPEQSSDGRVRLNKILADSGLASRRAADRLIEDGHVTVNGKKVYELGVKIDPKKDKILVDGKSLKAKSTPVYAIFNKPKGVLTTMEDPLGRPTVKDFLEKLPVRLFPVGRLDWDSEGLLILTNDGDYANKIMQPKAEVTKTYLVKVDGQPKPEHLAKLRRGVPIIGGRVAAKYVGRIDRGKDKYAWLKIVITEGKNRQIRLMFEKIGFDVLKLQRIAIGRLRLGQLERGEIAYLNEVAANMVFQQDMSGLDRETRRNESSREKPRRASSETTEQVEKSEPSDDRKRSARSESRARKHRARQKSTKRLPGKPVPTDLDQVLELKHR